jgi:hypothetical protein
MASFLFMSTDARNNRGQHQVMNSLSASVGSSGDTNDGTGGMCITPFDILLKNISRNLQTAVGAAKDTNFRIKKNQTTPANLTGIQTIAGATDTFVTSDVEAILPALNTTSNATILTTVNFLTEWTTGAPTGGNAFYAFEYQVQGVGHSRVSFYNVGSDFGSKTIGAAAQYMPIMGSGIQSTTQSLRKMLWPISGNFQFLAIAWKSLTAATTAELTLERSTTLAGPTATLMGPFSMSAASPTGNWQGTIDTSSTLAISAGEFVNWKLIRTAGTGTSIQIMICLGFNP